MVHDGESSIRAPLSESPGVRGLGLAPVQQVIAGSGTRKTIKAYDTERLATRWFIHARFVYRVGQTAIHAYITR